MRRLFSVEGFGSGIQEATSGRGKRADKRMQRRQTCASSLLWRSSSLHLASSANHHLSCPSLSLSLSTSAPTLEGEERRFVCRPLLMIVYMKFFLALLPLHPRFAPVRSDVSIASDKSRLLLSTSLISRINTEMSAIVTSSQQHYHHYY